MPLSIGRRLGHYEIIAPLGAGGMGKVYRATDTKLGRDVALKVLPAEMASQADRLARLQREARAVAALNHLHIVTIHSVEESNGVHFLTMELVEGQSLDGHAAPGGLPVARDGQVMGTVPYMAPEQLRGGGGRTHGSIRTRHSAVRALNRKAAV